LDQAIFTRRADRPHEHAAHTFGHDERLLGAGRGEGFFDRRRRARGEGVRCGAQGKRSGKRGDADRSAPRA
jgi:hypothetical protein